MNELQMTEEEEREAERYQKELADSLAMAEEVMPPEDYGSTLQPVARGLQDSMGKLGDIEMQFGSQPEAWEEYQPQHQEIQEKLQETTEVYRTGKTSEEKESVAIEAAQAMGTGTNILQQQYQKILEQDRQMREEMKAMRQQLQDMRELTKAYAPEEMAKAIAVGMKFLQQVDAVRQNAKEKRQTATALLYQDAKESVHEVYTNIKATPGRIKEAMKLKAYSVVDKGIRHVAGWFDKGISFIEKKKEEFLNLSPLEKEKKEANFQNPPQDEKQPEVRQTEPVSDEPAKTEKKEKKEAEKPGQTISDPAHGKSAALVDKMFSMKELLYGDSNKVVKEMVDFMVKNGGKETDIVNAFSRMKATATALMMLPEYNEIRSEAPAKATQR